MAPKDLSALRRALAVHVWPLRWVLLANAYLLSPLVVNAALHWRSSDVPPMLVIFTTVASVLWLVVFQLAIKRMWIAHALLFPFYLIVSIDLFVIINYATRFSASIISVILENFGDAPEYI